MSTPFDKALTDLPGVGKQRVAALAKEWQVTTYGDLSKRYPFRYEDRSELHQISQLSTYVDQPVQVVGTLSTLRPTGKRGPLQGTFRDETGLLELLWFHRVSWILRQYAVGQRYLLYGYLKRRKSILCVMHPELLPTGPGPPTLQIRPIYHSTDALRRVGLHSQGIAKLQQQLLPVLLPHVSDPLPAFLRQAHDLMPKQQAIQEMHQPSSLAQATAARKRLCFEEFLFFQLNLLMRAASKKKKQAGVFLKKRDLLHTFYATYMPFELTQAQQRVMYEIHADMCSGCQMNRLLQGDVGSGKTMVAWMSMLIVLSNGLQAALMVPTEVLAVQHATLLARYAEPMGISIACLSGSTPKQVRMELLAKLDSGELQILIGTHALLAPEVCFRKLGLIVIDEQHRFGVAQRALLTEKETNLADHPHILVMTATPIPRTLALTQYGELDVSIIDELPKGRKPIRTAMRTGSRRAKVYAFLRQQLAAGHRVYIVYPLIEDSEKLDLHSLSEEYATVQKAFSAYEVEKLHGRMPADEKKSRMQRFITGDAQVLVSTTVIEVGVDVPEATAMLIEHADRFGLAQLHQLRGRIGRGQVASYCIPMTEGRITADARARLEAFVHTQDGFLLAELDLQQRGPGNVLGTQQSGVWGFEVADLTQDGDLLVVARAVAQQILATDPELTDSVHQSLAMYLHILRAREKDWLKIG